ncbi:hypothetical protein GCM10010156_60500 [Planobispora rosea]|uniref:Uncharacterized protein n=1 Tax=Planobispora rosea TaxID=35762 RepID=A0A8J3S2Q8_PLARO|nr:hypothetical protein GCM10010156_60500 [Planobispora rosea]GIH87356.1 hypothetical protein Pro02_57640 [Planobispora rosea]
MPPLAFAIDWNWVRWALTFASGMSGAAAADAVAAGTVADAEADTAGEMRVRGSVRIADIPMDRRMRIDAPRVGYGG